jgi:hypothetical protein
MPAMSRKQKHPHRLGQDGFGLVAALFVVVFLALFGVLAARNLATTSLSSSEDYLWTQALYAAEATAHRRILFHDGGGGGAFTAPVLQNISTAVNLDTFVAADTPAMIETEGTVPARNIRRVIQVEFLLLP